MCHICFKGIVPFKLPHLSLNYGNIFLTAFPVSSQASQHSPLFFLTPKFILRITYNRGSISGPMERIQWSINLDKNKVSLFSLISNRNLAFPSTMKGETNFSIICSRCELVAKQNHRHFHISLQLQQISPISCKCTTIRNYLSY